MLARAHARRRTPAARAHARAHTLTQAHMQVLADMKGAGTSLVGLLGARAANV